MRNRQRTIKVFTAEEQEMANQLWMVIEQIELSFSYFYAQNLYSALIPKRFGKRRELSSIMSAGFIATLLSYRKLAEFFSQPSPNKQKRFPDDVRAINFGFHCACPPLGKKDLDELSKYSAHITKGGERLRMRGFNFGNLGNVIHTQCIKFFEFLEAEQLDRRVSADRQMLARLLSIRRQMRALTRRQTKGQSKAKPELGSS